MHLIFQGSVFANIFGLLIYILVIDDYPDHPAKTLKKKNALANYRMYRTQAYIKYALLYLLPPLILFAISLYLYHHPHNPYYELWKIFQYPVSGFLIANYTVGRRRHGGTYFYFKNTGNYKYKMKVKEEDEGWVTFDFIFKNACVLILSIILLYHV